MHGALVLLSVLLAFSGVPATAEARDCGGRRTCRCGDHVAEDYELVGNLGPCKKHGLTVRAGVTLDGGGHVLRGSRAKSSAGIMLDEKSTGARVVNLEVTGFERGVRLAGVSGAHVENVESHGNGDPVAHKGYGIDVARGASNNVIQNVHVHHNADEGIHIGNDARGNRVVSSRFEENYRENVYFLENDGNSLQGSTLVAGGASSVFVKHARNVRIEGNRIDGRGIQVRGDSSSVTIRDNQLSGAGLTVQPYSKGPRGKTVPRGITLAGGKIRSDMPCVRLIEARSVRLESAGLDCTQSLQLNGDSDATAVDTLIRGVECSGPGLVRELKTVDVRFVDGAGAPIADVEVVDASGAVAARSGADGRVRTALFDGSVRCPGPRRSQAGPVTIRSGDESRTIATDELSGDVRLGED